MNLLNMCLQIVPPPAGVATEMTHEGLDVVVLVHVVPEALRVSILLATLLTLKGLLPCVAPAVAPQTAEGGCVEATCLTHVGALLGVCAGVLGECCLLCGGVGAQVTFEGLVQCVAPDDVCLEFVVSQGGEGTLGALQGLGEWLPLRIALVLGG